MPLTTQQQMLVEQRVSNDRKSMLVAYVLLFLFGGLGIHRFYLGRAGTGVTMLLLTLIGMLTTAILIGMVLLAVVVVWIIVDLFLIPGMIDRNTQSLRTQVSNEVAVMAGD